MTKPTRYPEFSVTGTPKQLGRQIGEATRDQIRAFCEIAYDRVSKTVQISRDRAYDIARQSRRFAEDYRPDLIEELQGTAEAAGVTLDDLMLLQVRNQLQSDKAGGEQREEGGEGRGICYSRKNKPRRNRLRMNEEDNEDPIAGRKSIKQR